MNINQLAEQLATRFDSAQQTAENYLTQIEQVDGKTIDRDNISNEDAESVADAFDAGMGTSTADSQLADQLIELSEQIRYRQSELEELTYQRNELVNRLLDRANSVKDICEWSGLSRARIYAIKAAR